MDDASAAVTSCQPGAPAAASMSGGWTLVTTKGCHRQVTHPQRLGRVTISGNLGDEMPKGTFASVKRQAGWKGPKP